MKRSKYPKLRKVALVSLGLISALSLPVQAEEVFELDEIVVTATRTEQSVKETPASVQVISRKNIETMGAQSVVAALKLALNLNLSEAGMTGKQVSLRGMNTNQSLILIDGRRLAGEDTGTTANFYELDRININNVERIEIVRGPVSSLYGSDALGGVINIIMRKPEKQQSTIGLANSSRQQNASYHIDMGKQGKWAWSLDTLFTDIKEVNRSDSTNMYGPRQFYNFSGTYDLAADKKLDVFYERMSEHLKSDFSDDNSRDYYTNTRNSYGVTLRGQTDRGNYELRTYYNELEKNNDTVLASGTYSDFDRARYNTWVIDGKNTTRLNDKHVLTYGGEYRSNEYRGTRLEDNGDAASVITEHGISKAISEKSVKYQAAYVQDEWKLSDKLLLIPSLRYDDSDKFEDSLSPKLGMTYKVASNFRLKTNFGKGFKAPSISELYMKMTHRPIPAMTVIVSGNPNLKPEKSTSYDISLEGESGANFGKVTYFDNDVNDLIDTQTTRAGMVYTSKYVNVDKAKIKGWELEGGRHLSDRFTLKTAYTHLDARNAKTNEFLDSRAKNRYSVQLHYDDSQNSGVSSILWQEWVRDYRYSDVDYSYNTLNFTINKKWNECYSTYFGVDNILDKKIDELVLEGRLWRFGMNYTF
ncbi:Colicin I receptor precursor [Sporomusa ovata DSM 2662]|uniref:TonB-dependent receptor Outer membrane receptor for ferrienterochelin and colicins n=1 Tax=Sporomusa ovata TaxID=2378 RepID=A0A0U1KZB6_9FIRM|nr:TonB-dependent receptor [Sporomusa ovata]EQB27824.1 colicin I receptor [Sporomusa ovata DSM 2662]CQR72757.1 TonB-dependent receptor; Outer membrane receptor for ferrienterochelin and colicins [Sporomusa ovata]